MDRGWLRAGRVGSPHGLDGSFHVGEPRPQLLQPRGDRRRAATRPLRITRRAGTDQRLILRLEGCDDRPAAQALRGEELLVARTEAPELEPDEWWAEDLEGCTVHDAGRPVGTVRRLLALPSCEVLEVRAPGEAARPARSAGQRRGPLRRRRAARDRDRSRRSWGSGDGDRRLHAVPGGVRVVRVTAPRHQRARRRPPARLRQLPRPHAAQRRARSTTRRSAAAPAWCCGSTWSRRRCGRATASDPVELRAARRVIALTPSGPSWTRTLVDELAGEPALTLLSGRYEGFDERVLEHFATDRLSIGRYVLAGGELAAMVAVRRRDPQAARRARPRALGGGGVVQRGARGRARVPALHAPGRVSRLAGPGGPALGPPRADPRMAPRAEQIAPRARSATIGRPRGWGLSHSVRKAL